MMARLAELRDDRRGAVMVIGVFFAAFLVGGLWYVAGVGNAILLRERLQDGGDAATFASAVYHARGMNIIAMINLIMAAVLAVLVALKIIYMLLTITYIILTIICAFPFGGEWACPLASLAQQGAQQTKNTIDTVGPQIHNILKVLSKLENGVAKAVPWLAEYKTIKVAKLYQKPVDGGLMLSESLLPSGKRLGLPVEEDSYSVLCDKAALVLADVVMLPFSALGLPTQWAGPLVQGLVDIAPSYFCDGNGGGGSGNSGGSGKDMSAMAAQVCQAQQKQVNEQNKKNSQLPKKQQKPPIQFNWDDCMKEQTKKLKGKSLPKDSGGGDSSGETPKKVFSGAKAGDRFFNITGYAWADMKLSRLADKRVRIAAWGKKLVSVPKYWGQVQMSNAEFYYDKSGTWDSVKDDAMWNMRWRARMRRYHEQNSPDHGLMSKVASIASIAPGVLDALAVFQAGGLSGLESAFASQSTKKRLSDLYLKDATKTLGGDGYKAVDHSSKMQVVH